MKGRSGKNSSMRINQRGIELADRGWLEEALREFDRAIAMDQRSPFPRINRASVLAEQGRYLDALLDLLTASRQSPEEPATHFHLGMFLSRYGSQLAVNELQTSLGLDPEQPDALIQLGCTLADRGELQAAEETLQSAIDLDPEDPVAHHELGLLYMDRGRAHEAIRHLALAVAGIPEDIEIKVDLGTAYHQAGFVDVAERILREVLLSEPRHVYANYNLASLAVSRHDLENCFGYLGIALEENRQLVLAWLSEDTYFDSVRSEPRFSQLTETKSVVIH